MKDRRIASGERGQGLGVARFVRHAVGFKRLDGSMSSIAGNSFR